MSSVQAPVYAASTPLSYEVVPNTATIIAPSSAVPVVSTSKRSAKRNSSLKKDPSALPIASFTPIDAVPIVATDAGPVYQVELNKRLLDGQRELKEKQAEMEADKEKKLEEKADKHRTKAVKWIGRGYPGMASKHEKSATKLDVEANKHYMMAEQLRAQAKAIDRERKAFDPPKEEMKKKPVSKNAAMRRPAAPSSSSSSSSSGAPPQRSTSSTATTQPAPGGQQRSVERREVVDQRPVQPSLQKEEPQPSLRKEEVAPVRMDEAVVTPATVDAPVEEVKTTERKVETPEGDKKVEKKEEKNLHNMLHHHEKSEQSAGGSSH